MADHDGPLIEKEMAEQYGQALRDAKKPFMLGEEVARQLMVKCIECGSPKVVYAITKTVDGWPPGAYCYKCLLAMCKKTRQIPFPMPEVLLDNIKKSLGVVYTQAPVIIGGRSFYPPP